MTAIHHAGDYVWLRFFSPPLTLPVYWTWECCWKNMMATSNAAVHRSRAERANDAYWVGLWERTNDIAINHLPRGVRSSSSIEASVWLRRDASRPSCPPTTPPVITFRLTASSETWHLNLGVQLRRCAASTDKRRHLAPTWLADIDDLDWLHCQASVATSSPGVPAPSRSGPLFHNHANASDVKAYTTKRVYGKSESDQPAAASLVRFSPLQFILLCCLSHKLHRHECRPFKSHRVAPHRVFAEVAP